MKVICYYKKKPEIEQTLIKYKPHFVRIYGDLIDKLNYGLDALKTEDWSSALICLKDATILSELIFQGFKDVEMHPFDFTELTEDTNDRIEHYMDIFKNRILEVLSDATEETKEKVVASYTFDYQSP